MFKEFLDVFNSLANRKEEEFKSSTIYIKIVLNKIKNNNGL